MIIAMFSLYYVANKLQINLIETGRVSQIAAYLLPFSFGLLMLAFVLQSISPLLMLANKCGSAIKMHCENNVNKINQNRRK